MIAGVQVLPLKQFRDSRGAVFHMMRSTDSSFSSVKEVYFSQVNRDVIKGWKLNDEKINHFAVPQGTLKVVIYDGRQDSQTYGEVDEFILGEEADNYQLLIIPAELWYSFKGISENPALIANCASEINNPEKSHGLELHDPSIPYDWKNEEKINHGC